MAIGLNASKLTKILTGRRSGSATQDSPDTTASTPKVAVVTGAAGGIGRALADRFLADGYRVALLDHNADALARAHEELGLPATRVMAERCDVTDASSCEAVISNVIERWGGIDVLVNNAGITHMSLVADTDAATVSRVMDVNFHGAVHCTQAALSSLVERRGSVIAISSVAGFAPLVGRCAYSASKHALHGYFETLRAEMRDQGVHVMMVCPAYTRTGIHDAAIRPDTRSNRAFETRQPGRVMTPAEVAGGIADGIERRRDQVNLSPIAKASWWISRLAPRVYEWSMRRAHS